MGKPGKTMRSPLSEIFFSSLCSAGDGGQKEWLFSAAIWISRMLVHRAVLSGEGVVPCTKV